jgi:hypothetical protein
MCGLMTVRWTDSDREELARRGIRVEEAERQIETLRRPPRAIELDRPATTGDGIVSIDDGEVSELHARHEAAASRGRILKFVPASGAASRMFKELLHFQCGPGRTLSWDTVRSDAERGDANARALVRFLDELDRFPFRERLDGMLRTRGLDARALRAAGDYRPILDALLARDGLDFDAWPKGLLPFHDYAGSVRTPFEEHLVEAAEYARDADGRARLHFTVSIEHREAFERLLAEVRERYEGDHACRYDVSFSSQRPSTDTLAVDRAGEPFRDASGRLRFRPGGHGSLLANLGALGGDLVVVKNIDNVQPDDRRAPMVAWKKTLIGYVVRLEERVREHLSALERGSPTASILSRAAHFARNELMVELGDALPESFEARRALLVDRLSRPLRVCGMVKNTGEPGGGPFWCRASDGTTGLQIVESAEVDRTDDRQRAILGAATHFNPVDLVCAVRDGRGRPFDLDRFVDPDAGIVTRKSEGGRELHALERPGLWNGAMARWNSVFVEVPLETFSPVKTVLDLLRDEHQPGR